MTQHRKHRTARHLAQMAVPMLAAASLIAGCSSSSGTAGTSSAPPTSSPPTESSAPSAAPAQTVAMGATVTLPSDTVTVSSFADKAATTARKPSTASTHWATAQVKQCATGASGQGQWKLALKDGTTAAETTEWYDELPTPLQQYGDPLAAGDCVSGLVYFVMPDGAVASGVVLQPTVTAPTRPQVTWTIG